MRFTMIPKVFAQMFKKPFTNKFPAKYAPPSTTKFLADVGAGKAKIIPPIETPPGFRGKIQYDTKKCIGCKLCEIVCPVGAIIVHPDKHVAIKCDLCAVVGEPQCAKYCYTGALQLLPADRVGMARARAKSEKFIEMERKGA